MSGPPATLQDLIFRLQSFWAGQGCVIQLPYDVEKGAGTMTPETFLRVLEPWPYRVAYVEPSRRPADARYGENPFRLEKHHQLQVVLKPSPSDVQDLYIASLEAIGIPLAEHDLRFEEDNWESPTLGAWGVGWQVMLDGLEITQFTYFQQAGGQDLPSVPVEITLGLERLLMFIAGKDNIYDIEWAPGVSYRRVRHRDEYEFSKYYFEEADVAMTARHFDDHEGEARRLLDGAAKTLPRLESGEILPGGPEDRALLLAAHDSVLRCSHLFNVLDARGAISVTERAGFIRRIRRLAVREAELYVRLCRVLSSGAAGAAAPGEGAAPPPAAG